MALPARKDQPAPEANHSVLTPAQRVRAPNRAAQMAQNARASIQVVPVLVRSVPAAIHYVLPAHHVVVRNQNVRVKALRATVLLLLAKRVLRAKTKETPRQPEHARKALHGVLTANAAVRWIRNASLPHATRMECVMLPSLVPVAIVQASKARARPVLSAARRRKAAKEK